MNFPRILYKRMDVCATNIFKLVIYWFTVSRLFWSADIFKFAEVELIRFILVGFMSCPGNLYLPPRLWKYSALFSLRNMDFGFIVRSMMDFGLIFEYGVRWDPHSFFPLYTSIYLITLFIKSTFFSLDRRGPVDKDLRTVYHDSELPSFLLFPSIYFSSCQDRVVGFTVGFTIRSY